MTTLDAPQITKTYPSYETGLRELVAQHLELGDDAPILAVYYAPQRFPEDVFLLEVSPAFVGNGGERNWFEVTYASTPGFPLASEQYLHLVLTNPEEFKQAAQERWASFTELEEALQRRQAMALHGTLSEWLT